MKLKKYVDILFKRASLISNVAIRAMLSLYEAHEFDLKVARLLIGGAKDVLFLSQDMFLSEMRSYLGDKPKITQLATLKQQEKPSLENLDNYIKFYIDSEQIFADKKGWLISYGGEKYRVIAEVLIDIAKYLKLCLAYKDSDKEIDAINRLSIYLNVFDNLSHNTGGVYDKLLFLENPEEDISETYKKDQLINKIRDISESENETDILKTIHPHLEIDLPFKQKIRNVKMNPEYYSDSSERIENSLNKTKNIRALNAEFSRITNHTNYILNNAEQQLEELKTNFTEDNLFEIQTSIYHIGTLDIFLSNVKRYVAELKKYNINVNIDNLEKIYLLVKNLDGSCGNIEFNKEYKDYTIEKFSKLIETLKQFIKELNIIKHF